jgi:ribulose-5-phosphate 4-epimerase/fuculose-1-phosphate aldolase
MAPDANDGQLSNSSLDTPEVRQARIDLAACFRMAARLGMHEGICNHFSFMVPGRDDLFMVNPDGYAFSEITASKLLICDFDGTRRRAPPFTPTCRTPRHCPCWMASRCSGPASRR